MSPTSAGWLRVSLIIVWLASAATSAVERHGLSEQLLLDAGLPDAGVNAALIWGGVTVDTALGLALWLRPSRRSYTAALLAMLSMTVVATALTPTLWLHPLGPLFKNIPIAAMLWVLIKESS